MSTTNPASDRPDTSPLRADAPIVSGLRGVRYGEVFLLRSTDDGRFEAEVWNTLGLNDCPQAAWDQLDPDAITAERGALLTLLNGPRYWLLDFIQAQMRASAPETTFGDLAMWRAALIDFGTEPPVPGPYLERSIVRETIFGYDAGRELYQLVAPDGTTYVMQAYANIVDPDLTEADLAGLATRLSLPEGWAYRVLTTPERLELRSIDGIATVLQDDLQNTYQRIDRP